MKIMRYPGIMLLLVAVLCFSCGEKELPIPLSEEKMIDVLIELHIAESMLEKLPITDQDTVGHVYYRMIFRDNGVTQEEFDQSMGTLREDPKRLNRIYEQILEKLNVLEATGRGVENMEDPPNVN